MSVDAKEIFTKLGSAEEKSKLLKDMVQLKIEVVCKLANNENLIVMDVLKYEKNGLTCALRKGSLSPQGLPAQAIVSFEVNNEKFFMTSTMSILQAGYFDLRVGETPIFRLQRRQSYRVRVPDYYATKVEIQNVNGVVIAVNGKIADLSTGGCRLKIMGERKPFKMGDTVDGKITLGGKQPFVFRGGIRFERSETSPPAHLFGIEFLELPPEISARLFAITLELHREVFSKID